ncbi:hypothetical protein [Actinomadura rudentiformis]|uniref:Uncharacterized protein n=1 Tax=Actinomadura rudentiformis TaxID=359158 RepID=A0A6H9YQF2_9ACTN|nr:hypothetical protein [Actinomadura rudentiformis]KAB2345123.1 hypothetical protein F8566_28000 [Actinomadura rudentiformis]
MPEDAMARTEAESHYRDLVRLAYFVLPGNGKRFYRLAIAQRIVDGVLAGGGFLGLRRRTPAKQRTKVLRMAMRPSWRLRIGLGPWLRALPAKLPDPALTKALAGMEPRVRVAYVLRHIEGLPRYAVRDQLVELRFREVWPIIDAADATDRPAARPEPFEPTPVRLGRRPVLPIAAATLVTLLIGALIASGSGGSLLGGALSAEARKVRLSSAAPDAWTRHTHTLDVWPARGDLVNDRAFTARAVDAWSRKARLSGKAQLLFAGRVSGVPIALLRHRDRIARYTGSPEGLEVTAAGTDASNPIALGGGRYLLAPWDTGAMTPSGRKVTVTGGVTDAVTVRTRCRRGPLLDLSGDDGSRTVGEFGGIRPVTLTYRSPTSTAPLPTSPSVSPSALPATSPAAKPATSPAKSSTASAKPRTSPANTAKTPAKSATAPVKTAPVKPVPVKSTRLKAANVRLWDRLSCLLPQPARPVIEALAWDFWAGSLPHGGGRAQWVCTRMAFAGGGDSAQAALVAEKEELATGRCDGRQPVSGTWWKAPSDRWYYLAAAARDLVPHAEGPVSKPKVTKRLLVGSAPQAKQRPESPVTLTTRPE